MKSTKFKLMINTSNSQMHLTMRTKQRKLLTSRREIELNYHFCLLENEMNQARLDNGLAQKRKTANLKRGEESGVNW